MKHWTDWYKVNLGELIKYVGYKMLWKYQHSFIPMLLDVYAHHPWEEWRFARPPEMFWNNMRNRRKYLDWLMVKASLSNPKALWHLNEKFIRNHYGNLMLRQYSYQQTLLECYPGLSIVIFFFVIKVMVDASNVIHVLCVVSVLIAPSLLLFADSLNIILPNQRVRRHFQHPKLLHSSGTPMELDIYYPDL